MKSLSGLCFRKQYSINVVRSKILIFEIIIIIMHGIAKT